MGFNCEFNGDLMGSDGIFTINNADNGDISGKIITTSLNFPNPGIMVNKENYPKMAQHFGLVTYYNLP